MMDKSFLIDVMHCSAAAAYQAMQQPQAPLTLPEGYQSVGLIRADVARAQSLLAQAPEEMRAAIDRFLAESSVFGYVSHNAAQKTTLVAFRGTQTWLDWIDDFGALLAPYLPEPSAGLVHLGFLIVFEHIRDSAVSLLQSQAADTQRLLITGHSLGGALASLFGYHAADKLSAPTPELCTFASPRAGAPQFAASFNRKIPNCVRVVNFMDVVPQLPLPPLFKHEGEELLVRGGFKPLDPAYAHHMSTYLDGLQKL